MIPDHYATLGVAPNARPATIRAAYLELMRRYHPDRNLSAGAATQSRVITAAYAVLGATDRRSQYDLERRRHLAAQYPAHQAQRLPWWTSPWLPLSLGVAAIVLLVPMLFQPPLISAEQADQIGPVTGLQTAVPQEKINAAIALNPIALCSSLAVSNLIKRALFNRAARLRGGKLPAEFGTLAAHSVLRIESPLVANAGGATGVVNCKAAVIVDLPMTAKDGARSLRGTVDYALKPHDNGNGGTVSVTAVGSLVGALATLGPMPRLAAETQNPSTTIDQNAKDQLTTVANFAPPSAPPVVPVKPRALQNPSFSCGTARTSGATLVCNSASLAAVDREMARLYGHTATDAKNAALLLRGEARFLARRDACSSEACVLNTYFARIREIQDIAAGH